MCERPKACLLIRNWARSPLLLRPSRPQGSHAEIRNLDTSARERSFFDSRPLRSPGRLEPRPRPFYRSHAPTTRHAPDTPSRVPLAAGIVRSLARAVIAARLCQSLEKARVAGQAAGQPQVGPGAVAGSRQPSSPARQPRCLAGTRSRCATARASPIFGSSSLSSSTPPCSG